MCSDVTVMIMMMIMTMMKLIMVMMWGFEPLLHLGRPGIICIRGSCIYQLKYFKLFLLFFTETTFSNGRVFEDGTYQFGK